jgi:putative SOS response-associated peptidase YedK
MCDRYVLPDQPAAEREFLPDTAWWNFAAKFNVPPAQYVPAIRLHAGRSEGVMLRWGLIPSWFEGEPQGPPRAIVASARLEQSDAHRVPWRNGQRCILPAAGFYSWRLTRERYRQPFFVRLTRRSVFGIAAVWDRWVSADDDVIEGCSMVTVPANELMAEVGDPGREMPAILRRQHYQAWLRGTPAEAQSALRPYDFQGMQAFPVSPRVNCIAVDDPGLIRAAPSLLRAAE